MTRRRAASWVVASLFVLLPAHETLRAYLPLAVSVSGGRVVSIRWSQAPVRWFATDRGVPGVSASAFQATMARAFATWEAVPTATIAFQFVGFTSAEPFDDDGISVLGFQDAPELERVLGATGFTVDTVTGEIVESDVFFNATFAWSTASAGDPARFDLESVAVHEIGHFIGLGHSALGETELVPGGGRRVLGSAAVMFPISLGRGSIQDRTLQPDDIAGVSTIYPAGDFEARTGQVDGRVVKNGAGVQGAHVTVFNPATTALIGGFAVGSDGAFQIGGLSPGPYILRVEPLDDADVESFFDGPVSVDIGFGVAIHPQFVVAPAGGAGDSITVTVQPK